MLYHNQDGNMRKFAYAEPTFRLSRQRIELRLIRGSQVLQPDGSWIDVEGSVREGELVTITDRQTVDVRTLKWAVEEEHHIDIETEEMVIDQEATPAQYAYPAYSFMMGATPTRLGMDSLDGYVYAAIATQVETYLTANGLVGE